MAELEVLLHGRLAGHLVESNPGDWHFVYTAAPIHEPAKDDQLPAPLSLALPRERERHYGSSVRAVFSNLLPDGSLRQRLAQSLGYSQGNDFGLLSRVGGECIGAVRIRQPGALFNNVRAQRALEGDDLRNVAAVLPIHPLLAEADNLSKSLPGEFDKLPVRFNHDQVRIVLGDELTTHILKPAKPGLRETVFNEAFCMQLAGRFGLPVAPSRVIHDQVNFLLVDRIDRAHAQTVQSLHFEDFCQALGHLPERKYEREGGPRLSDIAAILRRASGCPAIDLRALVQWVIFGFFVGFGAAHAKQLGLLYSDRSVRLAPFFGIWSTHVYPEMNFRLGFRIGDEDRPDWIHHERWRDFARSLGVRPAYVISELAEAAVALPRLTREVAEMFQRRNGYAEVVRSITRIVDQRARQVLVGLEAETASDNVA